jgi:hypothetical protein
LITSRIRVAAIMATAFITGLGLVAVAWSPTALAASSTVVRPAAVPADVQVPPDQSTPIQPGAISGGAAGRTIVCTPNVQNPHNSSHVKGTVNVVVTLKCTSAVSSISIRAALYRNGHLVAQSGVRTVRNTSSAQNNAAKACQSGTYVGWMAYVVVFPPGYVPPTGSSSGFGRSVKITC